MSVLGCAEATEYAPRPSRTGASRSSALDPALPPTPRRSAHGKPREAAVSVQAEAYHARGWRSMGIPSPGGRRRRGEGAHDRTAARAVSRPPDAGAHPAGQRRRKSDRKGTRRSVPPSSMACKRRQSALEGADGPAGVWREGLDGVPGFVEGADVAQFDRIAVRAPLDPSQREALGATHVGAVLVDPARARVIEKRATAFEVGGWPERAAPHGAVRMFSASTAKTVTPSTQHAWQPRSQRRRAPWRARSRSASRSTSAYRSAKASSAVIHFRSGSGMETSPALLRPRVPPAPGRPDVVGRPRGVGRALTESNRRSPCRSGPA